MKKYTLGLALMAYSLSYSITPCPLTLNAEGVYEVGTYEQLKQVALCPLDGTYRLTADIDASASASEKCIDAANCIGFASIGSEAVPFSGTFHGGGHTISGLFINRTGTSEPPVGLFMVNSGTIDTLGLENCNIKGGLYTGCLVGGNLGTINYSYATGMVKGYSGVGGLAGKNSGTINKSYYNGEIGFTLMWLGAAGLVGENYGSISQSYAEASIHTSTYNTLGGVVTSNGPGGNMSSNYWNSELNNNTGSNVNASGSSTSPIASAQAQGLSSIKMRQKASYEGWDFENTWVIYEGLTTPLLRAYMQPLTVGVESAHKMYDGEPIATPLLTYDQDPVNSDWILGSAEFTTGASAVDVGNYELGVTGGLYSPQRGYVISFAKPVELSITPAPLTITANDVEKTYGQADPQFSYTTTGLVPNDVLSGTLTRESGENVGTYGITQGTLGNTNYNISFTGAKQTIAPAPLVITVLNDTLEQGQTPPPFRYQFTGFVAGEDSTVLSHLEVSHDALSNLGDYPLHLKAEASNYTLTLVDGILTVKAPVANIVINRFQQGRVQILDNGLMIAGYRGPLHVYSPQGKQLAVLNITHDGFYAIDSAPGRHLLR